MSQYRNYESLDLELGSGLNIIHGANAQGKTNLLEGLYLVATGRILRGGRDTEVVGPDSDEAHVEVELLEGGTEIKVVVGLTTRKRAFLNGVSTPRVSDVLGRLPTVIFWSEDLDLVRGSGTGRRLFLDIELSQVFPAYMRHLTVYKRALEQRNALLKMARDQHVPADLFEPWEAEMMEHGKSMREYRRAFIEEIGSECSRFQASLGGGEALSLAYDQKDDGDLASSRRVDLQRGTTGVGPHRDDLEILVEGRPIRHFGSQGQQRTACLALKLSTLGYVRNTMGVRPVVLLDDVLSDLDVSRREQLLAWVDGLEAQTVITCTEPELVAGLQHRNKRLFRVREGKVEAS
jgi:DNA replication and repair protein RecF